MNILILTPGKLPVPPIKGGAVETLIQLLLDDNSFIDSFSNIDVITIDDKDIILDDLDKKINYYFVKIDDFFYKIFRAIRYLINRIPGIYIGNEYIVRVNKILKKLNKNYDLIIVENSPEYVLKIPKKYYKKIMLHLHNDFLNTKTSLSKKIFNTYDRILCLSDFVSNKVNAIDFDNKKAYTCYNGIDLDKFKIVSSEKIDFFRNKYGINDRDFVYIYSGRLTEEKGIGKLIDAFLIVNQKFSNVKLLVCGRLLDNSFVKKIVSKANDNIIFTDYIKNEELLYLYNIADVGVVPSIVEEGFGLIIVENFACGNPVIVSDSGGMIELVNNNNGIIFERQNFVDNLVNSMIFIQKQKFDKSKIVDSALIFSKEIYVKKFLELVQEEEDENKN